jgi:hypothetical protein
MYEVIGNWVDTVRDNFNVYHRFAIAASGVDFFFLRGVRIMRVSDTMIYRVDAGF